jgi:general secretion pathway protein K
MTAAPQRGLALIIAMLVAALAAAVAMSLASAQNQWSAQVAHRRDQVQAQSIALAGVQWARQVLDQDARTTPIDHLGEPWALPLPATPVEGGSVEGRIVDAQSRLNVNDLASGAHAAFARARFARLFETLRIAPATLASLVDWVDADDVPEANGAESAWYAAQPQPGLAPNMPVARLPEIAEVRGMTTAALSDVERIATALPADTPLNVNTASDDALAASIAGIDRAQIAALIARRAQRPFATIAEFRSQLPPQASIGDEAMYSVSSRYFLVTVRARQGDTLARAQALIERGGSGWPRVVWQTVE